VIELTQLTTSGLNAYGWACLLFFVVTMGEAIRKEVSGQARKYGWAPRAASWMYAAACLLMAGTAWYLAGVLRQP
jgi:hypothetical protein